LARFFFSGSEKQWRGLQGKSHRSSGTIASYRENSFERPTLSSFLLLNPDNFPLLVATQAAACVVRLRHDQLPVAASSQWKPCEVPTAELVDPDLHR
jgi:hypothetical protein